jgi:transposase-like protein
MKIAQSIPASRRFTINDFNAKFPDDDACLDWLMERRHAGKIATCSYCRVDRKHHRIATKKAYACDYCGTYISPMAGTIFEKSSTPLRLWFYAMYLMSATRCGVSAKQIQRETGVTYKTAWRMFKQIRSMLGREENIGGPDKGVEVDEMYYGGKRKGGAGRPMRGDKVKTPVLGMVERDGSVVALSIPDTTAKTICGSVHEFVLPATTVFTDELGSYNTVAEGRRYTHHRIKHSEKIYVVGDVHTNTIEGFWSLIKRGIGGVYHSVSRQYLQSYLDEYSFRYNRRNDSQPMFNAFLNQVVEKAQ